MAVRATPSMLEVDKLPRISSEWLRLKGHLDHGGIPFGGAFKRFNQTGMADAVGEARRRQISLRDWIPAHHAAIGSRDRGALHQFGLGDGLLRRFSQALDAGASEATLDTVSSGCPTECTRCLVGHGIPPVGRI